VGTTNFGLTTLPANAVIDDTVLPALKVSVGSFTTFHLTAARNVGANPLDGLPAGVVAIQLVAEWSIDGVAWQDGMSASFPGGVVFQDKAQTIRAETVEIDWPFGADFPAAQFLRGRVVNGPNQCTVSGSVTFS